MPVVIVPTEQEGLTIFPTHRIALRTAALPELQAEPSNGLPFAEVYTRAGSGYLVGEEGELDAELVARYAPEVRYTPSADEARAAVEAAVIARLDGSGLEFPLVSEELGRRGDGPGLWVVLDPIDGSINAKRGLPFFSLSIAIAEGGTMDDVVFGYVYDFGASEEWTA